MLECTSTEESSVVSTVVRKPPPYRAVTLPVNREKYQPNRRRGGSHTKHPGRCSLPPENERFQGHPSRFCIPRKIHSQKIASSTNMQSYREPLGPVTHYACTVLRWPYGNKVLLQNKFLYMQYNKNTNVKRNKNTSTPYTFCLRF